MMQRTTIQADPDSLVRWRAAAQEQGVSLSQLVRDSVEDRLRHRRPSLTFLGSVSSGITDSARQSAEATFVPPPWRSEAPGPIA